MSQNFDIFKIEPYVQPLVKIHFTLTSHIVYRFKKFWRLIFFPPPFWGLNFKNNRNLWAHMPCFTKIGECNQKLSWNIPQIDRKTHKCQVVKLKLRTNFTRSFDIRKYSVHLHVVLTLHIFHPLRSLVQNTLRNTILAMTFRSSYRRKIPVIGHTLTIISTKQFHKILLRIILHFLN